MIRHWLVRMTRDHRRLAALLAETQKPDAAFDPRPFEELRVGLLTHIAIEEKILMPLLAAAGESAGLLRTLRADHSALAALTVPTPRPEIAETIRDVLEAHDPLEEGPSGLYARCEQLAAGQEQWILQRLERFAPAVPSPWRDGTAIERHIRWSLEQAAAARATFQRELGSERR